MIKKSELKSRIKLFGDMVEKYLDYFGLKDWEVRVIETSDDTRGQFWANHESRMSSIEYGKVWIREDGTSNKEIEKVAFHECAELFLSETRRDINHYEGANSADRQIHHIIRFMENVHFGQVSRPV